MWAHRAASRVRWCRAAPALDPVRCTKSLSNDSQSAEASGRLTFVRWRCSACCRAALTVIGATGDRDGLISCHRTAAEQHRQSATSRRSFVGPKPSPGRGSGATSRIAAWAPRSRYSGSGLTKAHSSGDQTAVEDFDRRLALHRRHRGHVQHRAHFTATAQVRCRRAWRSGDAPSAPTPAAPRSTSGWSPFPCL